MVGVQNVSSELTWATATKSHHPPKDLKFCKKKEATPHSGPTMADAQKSSTDENALRTRPSHSTSGVSYHIKLDSTGNVGGDRTLSEKCLKLIPRCNVGSSRTALKRSHLLTGLTSAGVQKDQTQSCWRRDASFQQFLSRSPNNMAHS